MKLPSAALLTLACASTFACSDDKEQGWPGGGDDGATDSGDGADGTDGGDGTDGTDGTDGGGDGPCDQVPEGLDLDAAQDGFLYAGQILAFCITLDDDDVAALTADPRADVHADVTFGGTTVDAGLHLKGSDSGSFRTLEEKASFKIDFHEWDEAARLHGVKRLTLNSMIQDPTMAAEHVAYHLGDALGIPGPRHGYANVWVNDELFGLYGVVETQDEEFLERAFPDEPEGNLYAGGYGADLYNGREDNFGVSETMGEVEDRSDLLALIEAVEAATPATFYTMLGERFHRDELLAFMAWEIATSNVDAYTTNGNNFQLYHGTADGLWWLTPWGPDQSFYKDGRPEVEVYQALYGRLGIDCRASAECSAALDLAIEAVLVTWEGIDLAAYVDETTAAIEADCRADPRSNYGDYGCRDAQAAMRDWVRARPAAVRAELAAH